MTAVKTANDFGAESKKAAHGGLPAILTSFDHTVSGTAGTSSDRDRRSGQSPAGNTHPSPDRPLW